MSDPAAPESPPSGAPAGVGAARPARPARWLNRLSVLLLVTGAGVATGAAAPELLRAAGFEPVVLAEPRVARMVAPSAARRGAVSFDEHPQFVPDDDSARLTELERMYPDEMWPGLRPPVATDGLRPPPEPRDTPSPAKPRVGHALSAFTLRERSDAAATVTGQVPEGARLMVVRESGDWAMVVYGSPDGVLVGWTKRATVALGNAPRPHP